MTDGQGPWRPQPPHSSDPPPEKKRPRRVAVLVLMAAVAVGVWALMKLAPGRVSSGEDLAWVFYSLGMIVLVGSSLFARGLKLRETLRYGLVWAGIAGAVLVGYAFRNELGAVGMRVRSEVAPAYAVNSAAHEMTVTRDQDGAFYVMAQVNGRPVRFLVDTGASGTVLSPADARRLGVDVAAMDYPGEYETANGVGRGAPFTADTLAVGPIRLADLPMSINQAPMSSSLLGMTFLNRLESFEVRGDRLYLRWRA